jgi:16S rRNA (cytidine1402-2'-O)-methyltransferase
VAGTLYLVGTPIGNLEDLTERARRTLASVDLIAAEDTRRTGMMLKRLGIEGRLLSLFEGNEARRVPRLMEELRGGADVAVVSDAGMPGLSDPGYRLVAACVEEGIPVDVVPGPSAAVAALVVSGLPTDRFVFEGFLPRAGKQRAERMAALASEERTIVLFESPRRVVKTLSDLTSTLGDRAVAVARELTKLHQEVIRGRLGEVVKQMGAREPRGEFVIVVEGASGPPPDGADAVRIASELVAAGLRKRDAARRASELTGEPARPIYEALVGRERYGAAGSTRGSDRRPESSE